MDAGVSLICYDFDAGSVHFDDQKEPPGWASRHNFPVRIISRQDSIYEAVSASIRQYMMCPLNIWTEFHGMPRDAHTELSRAYPPFNPNFKRLFCEAIKRFVPQILTEYSTLKKVPMYDDDFFYALEQSKLHHTWNVECCENCHIFRKNIDPVIVMRPCAHILCAKAQCFDVKRMTRCPLCKKKGDQQDESIIFQLIELTIGEKTPRVIHPIEISAIMEIPQSIIDSCIKKIHDKCS